MKFTKVTRVQLRHPPDSTMALRKDFETTMFTTRMHLQNRTVHFYINHIDDYTLERMWVDQESAEEYIQHQQQMAAKYGGEVVSFEIKDIDHTVRIQ